MTYDDGRWTAVAANGDELWTEYSNGSGGAADDPLVSTFRDEVTIAGGTGRFAGATGEADESGVFSFATGSFEMEVDGYVDYEAANRSR